MLFEDCKQWRQVKLGIDIQSSAPTIAVFIPKHQRFESYDMIAAYFDNKTMIECRAFQLKEGRDNQARPDAADEVDKRFLVKGIPPRTEVESDENGWTVPTAEVINAFYGESGVHWTPREWKLLETTFKK